MPSRREPSRVEAPWAYGHVFSDPPRWNGTLMLYRKIVLRLSKITDVNYWLSQGSTWLLPSRLPSESPPRPGKAASLEITKHLPASHMKDYREQSEWKLHSFYSPAKKPCSPVGWILKPVARCPLLGRLQQSHCHNLRIPVPAFKLQASA